MWQEDEDSGQLPWQNQEAGLRVPALVLGSCVTIRPGPSFAGWDVVSTYFVSPKGPKRVSDRGGLEGRGSLVSSEAEPEEAWRLRASVPPSLKWDWRALPSTSGLVVAEGAPCFAGRTVSVQGLQGAALLVTDTS